MMAEERVGNLQGFGKLHRGNTKHLGEDLLR